MSDRQIIMGAHQKMTEMQPINYRFENLVHLLHNLFVGPFLVSLGLIHKRRHAPSVMLLCPKLYLLLLFLLTYLHDVMYSGWDLTFRSNH